MTYVSVKINVDSLQQILDEGLAETFVQELLDKFGSKESAACRHCQRPITRTGDGRWVHQGGGERMCRAAAYSYDRDRWLRWPASDRRTASPARNA